MQPAPSSSRAGSLPLVGGVLALDFCNTSSGRGTAGHLEHLGTWSDLLAWARHTGILDSEQDIVLRAVWGDDPGRGSTFAARAMALRGAIHRLVSRLAAAHEPDPSDVEAIGREHAACVSQGRLTQQNGAFGWTWAANEAPEALVLGPIAASAVTLIATADRGRLKQCTGHQCGWLFLDTTKSNNRRWCEMEVCGNRAKQKRRRAQTRSEP